MAIILNIETSTKVCSVALTAEGMVLSHFEDFKGQNHAAVLSDFIKKCLDYLREHEINLEAVAVSIGPGSYTGLRIGLSEAKGLAFALDLPLIGIPTLEIMAVHVMFNRELDYDALLLPMIDARRMEDYVALYDFGLSTLLRPTPLILDSDKDMGGLAQLIADKYYDNDEAKSVVERISQSSAVYFFGNGSEKSKSVFKEANFIHIPDVDALAVDMLALSERAYRDKNFLDLAYSTPEYLKDFQATKPKKLL